MPKEANMFEIVIENWISLSVVLLTVLIMIWQEVSAGKADGRCGKGNVSRGLLAAILALGALSAANDILSNRQDGTMALDLASAREERAKAYVRLGRMEERLALSREDLAKARAEREEAYAKLASLEAGLEAAKDELRQTRNDLAASRADAKAGLDSLRRDQEKSGGKLDGLGRTAEDTKKAVLEAARSREPKPLVLLWGRPPDRSCLDNARRVADRVALQCRVSALLTDDRGLECNQVRYVGHDPGPDKEWNNVWCLGGACVAYGPGVTRSEVVNLCNRLEAIGVRIAEVGPIRHRDRVDRTILVTGSHRRGQSFAEFLGVFPDCLPDA